MKMLGLIALIALVLLALFAVANWAALTTPVTLSFVAFAAEGPLGLILLCAAVFFAALFAVYALSLRTNALVEARRHMKALEAQRDLADKAEASRFTALGAQLEQEFAKLRASVVESRADARQRTDSLEASVRQSLSDTTSELAANIGQIDDKLNRMISKS